MAELEVMFPVEILQDIILVTRNGYHPPENHPAVVAQVQGEKFHRTVNNSPARR